jgi:two-component system, LytTR family, response regulator
MIRAITLDKNLIARNIGREFAVFEPNFEPIRELHYPARDQENTGQFKTIYDQNDFLLVKNEYKMVKVQVKDILFIEGKGNYISLHTSKFKLLTLQTMKKLEAFLLPYQFVRVHKSYIVSLQHLDSLDKHTIYINNIEIPISDSYRENLRNFLAANAKQI